MATVTWQRVQYRVGQVVRGLCPRLRAEDEAEVARWLTPAQVRLWQRQSARDRAHSLRVLRSLQRQGHTDPPLMAAALLHDVGKIATRIRLWHRVVWVLATGLTPRWAKRLQHPTGWRKPFWVLAEHPRLGADLVREAGGEEAVIWLVAHHQEHGLNPPPPYDRWLSALQHADEVN